MRRAGRHAGWREGSCQGTLGEARPGLLGEPRMEGGSGMERREALRQEEGVCRAGRINGLTGVTWLLSQVLPRGALSRPPRSNPSLLYQ